MSQTDTLTPPATPTTGTDAPQNSGLENNQTAKETPSQPKADGSSLLDKAGDKDQAQTDGHKPEVKSVVPEKYEFKAPEGMPLDQAAVDAFSPVAKELNLSQEQAQKVADIYAARVTTMQKEQEVLYQTNLKAMRDETIQSLGADWEREMSFAAKTRDRFFPASLMEMFNATGLSNNKDFIHALIKIGKEISEEKVVDGKPAGKGFDVEQMYPSMKKN